MIPCVIYAARSTKDEHASIPQQMSDCRAAIERLGGRSIIGTHSDEAKSAYHAARGDGLVQAKALAAAHPDSELWVQHSDRLARGDSVTAPHLVEVILWARQNRVTIRTVQDDSTGENLLMAVVMGERNWADSDRKSKSVKSGMKRGAARGKRMGGPTPYGVADGRIHVVQRIFREFVAGGTFSGIARGLHRDGVPTRKGGNWDPATIRGILSNPVYIGRVRYDGEVYESDLPALIPEPLWEEAARLLGCRPARGKGRPVASAILFRKGMLQCGLCGSSMIPSTRRDGVGEYRCNRASKLGDCDMPILKAREVDSKVLDYLLTVAVDLEATRKQLEEAQSLSHGYMTDLVHQAERASLQLSTGLEKVKRDYSLGDLPASDYMELKQDLEAQLAGAVGELERLQEQASQSYTYDSARDAEAQVLEHLTAIRAAIQGQVAGAAGLDSLRATIQRLFIRFEVTVGAGQGQITAIVRDEAVRTADETGAPLLYPQALPLDEGNSANGWPLPEFPSSSLFGPIRFGV